MDRATIARVQALGFDVWMRREQDSFMVFTDKEGKQLGYLEDTRLGFNLCTVHQPSMRHGWGFQIGRNEAGFTARDLEACFMHAPDWAWGSISRDGSVNKWRTIDHYRSASAWNAEYQKVEKVDA